MVMPICSQRHDRAGNVIKKGNAKQVKVSFLDDFDQPKPERFDLKSLKARRTVNVEDLRTPRQKRLCRPLVTVHQVESFKKHNKLMYQTKVQDLYEQSLNSKIEQMGLKV